MIVACIGDGADDKALSRRISSSLGAFSSRPVLAAAANHAALFLLDRKGARGPLKPALSPAGSAVLFHGWFDNPSEVAAALGLTSQTGHAALYGAAVDRWGDEAERRVVGCYCAILVEPGSGKLRLSRSAVMAPPLHYGRIDGLRVATSAARVFEAAGLAPRLNKRKLADSLFANATEDEGFLDGTFRVATGQIVHFAVDGIRKVGAFDALAPREIRREPLAELVEEADRLLEDACRVSLVGAQRPGVKLTGGLDSPNIAARVLRCLPGEAKLPSFTFLPLPGTPELDPEKLFADERGAVEAFAAMHPRIEPHFTDNADFDYETDLDRLIAAMGVAPGMVGITWAMRGLHALAGRMGCDVLLAGDHGNFTFSNRGDWAFGEYLREGKWRDLVRLLRAETGSGRPFHRRLISRAIVPNLPDEWWRRLRRWQGRETGIDNHSISLIRPEALELYDIVDRARESGVCYERDYYGRREQLVRDQWARGDADSADMHQGFEELYGSRWRDVAAYRPLVEFCLSLPVEAFIQGDVNRWLARELGRGLIPEAQRIDRRVGFQAGDWHQRLTPRLPAMRQEIERARAIPEVDELIDLDRFGKLLDTWPEEPTFDIDVFAQYGVSTLRALAAIRYIRQLTRTNLG